MQNSWYLVGEPVLQINKQSDFLVPLSQISLIQAILQEKTDEHFIVQKLREEFIAIVWAMKQMGIEFRIVMAHQDEVDSRVVNMCAQQLGCRFAGLTPDYFYGASAYPRDFAVLLPGVVLLNEAVAAFQNDNKDGYRLITTKLGEGGRLLHRDKTLVVSERFCVRDGRSQPPQQLQQLADLGFENILFPPPLSAQVTANTTIGRPIFNDHIDRVSALLRGSDGKLHLVLDHQIQCINWIGHKRIFPWIMLSHEETIKCINERCEHLGISVHILPKMTIPYALNLIQFHDSRVLMTSGDDAAAEIIGSIIGKQLVNLTEVPIKYFPLWKRAGIHCLVSEAPSPLFKKVNPTL